MHRIRHFIVVLTAVIFLGNPLRPTAAQDSPSSSLGGRQLIQLAPPGQREFILDRANLISDQDKATIRQLCDKLLTEKAAPIVVVTIHSMAEHGGDGMRIETFATLLFDQWQIGPAKLGKQHWNRGILLLVAQEDRKARIELGEGWKRDKDALCQQIMEQQIIPRFKANDYNGGILAGVQSLELMARDLQIPSPPQPPWMLPAVLATVGLGVFTVVSLIRRGSSGWAWLFWGAVFAVIGAILYFLASNSRGGSGGYSGGSFGGGGYSGGGGASGSW